jgi:sulfhydrogenase subunit gamma (sulfur reductase)
MKGNPYIPIPVKLKRTKIESDDKTLRTLDFVLCDETQVFDFMPGQFCQLSVLSKGEAPFGVASSPTEKGFLKFTVNRVGIVTSALHHLNEGEIIGMRGPLGNYYPVERFKKQNLVIIGGGFAFTTLRSLAVYLFAHRDDFNDITIIYGARRPGLLLYQNELAEWEKRDDVKLYLTIDKEVPEWNKRVGLIPAIVGEVAPKPKDTWAVVCGPPIMIKFTLLSLFELGFPPEKIYTSLERRMKCGIGKCGRCNIGPKYVCVDGPVFSLAELHKLPEQY